MSASTACRLTKARSALSLSLHDLHLTRDATALSCQEREWQHTGRYSERKVCPMPSPRAQQQQLFFFLLNDDINLNQERDRNPVDAN